ncbi:MAG: non-canonical purine NTP diphosphatase [Gillisia sp.]
MKLIFATHNKNKLLEIDAMMPPNFELLSLDDIGCTKDIPETSNTIEGNAILKADYVKQHYNLDCFADDTGLEVDILNGEPGVHSARYAGNSKDGEANISKLLENLKDSANRKAQFKTVIALNLDNHQILFIGICKGEITSERRGDFGFGYDSVFQPDGSDKTFGEMTLEEKSTFSHRGKALRELLDYLGS